MKKSKWLNRRNIILFLIIVGFGVSAYAYYDVGFLAPSYNGTASAPNPELGAIVLDTSSGVFYGNNAVPGASPYPNWNPLNGAGSSLPSGSIIAFGGTTAPGGFLICDGSAVSRTTYSALFAVIGTSYGAGNGTTTFNLPDLRGKFVRGEDNGAGNDPDAANRVDCPTGATTVGDVVGSCQVDQLRSHSHTFGVTAAGGGSPGTYGATAGPVSFVGGYIGSAGGSETRPLNVSVNYIIKL